MKRFFATISIGLLLSVGACGGGSDRDRSNRERDDDQKSREDNQRGKSREESGSGGVAGRYGEPGSSCDSGGVVEFTESGEIRLDGESRGTWRMEGSRLLVKVGPPGAQEEMEATRTADGIKMDEEVVSRCR
jgi:hypothetical protein